MTSTRAAAWPPWPGLPMASLTRLPTIEVRGDPDSRSLVK